MPGASESFHALLTSPVPARLLHRERGPQREPSPHAVAVTWLGTAGLRIEHAGRTLLVDPYLTRPGLRATLLAPLASDEAAVRRHAPRADLILCSHSHHDHLLDVPTVARQTGALVVGSGSAARYCLASGVPADRVRQVEPPATIDHPPFRVELRPSVHGRALLGRRPLPGEIAREPVPPLRVAGFRTPDAFGLMIRVDAGDGRELSIFHLGSADFLPESVSGLRCDVLVPCLVGRHRRPGYVRELLTALRPRVVVPCHFDDFFAPLGGRTRQLPRADLEGFVRAVRVFGDGARAVVLDRLETVHLEPQRPGAGRD